MVDRSGDEGSSYESVNVCHVAIPVHDSVASVVGVPQDPPEQQMPTMESPRVALMVASYLARTFEVWLRAFGLGFGAHLMIYLYYVKRDATLDEVKTRIPVSLVSGVAMACFVFGLSILLPTQFRVNWFDYAPPP